MTSLSLFLRSLRSLGPLALGLFVSLTMLPALASGDKEPSLHRLALLIGHNDAGGRAATLQYAEADARKMRDVLLQLGGYDASGIWLLLGQPDTVIRRTMEEISFRLKKLQAQPPAKRIEFFLYYSGHAQQGRLLLGDTSLLFREITTFLRALPVALRLVVFDACESGSLTTIKGLKRKKDDFRFPQIYLRPSAQGEVIITATGEAESAHEDPLLRGGIFTHYLVSGLRGDADRNGDGQITLEEAYLYAYNRSLERTIFSRRGPQRARFVKRLSGYGALILTRLQTQRAWLQLQKDVKGEFFIWNARRDQLLAEVIKAKGREVTVALSSGRYVLQWRRRSGIYHQAVTLQTGQRLQLGTLGQRLAYRQIPLTRGSDAPFPPTSVSANPPASSPATKTPPATPPISGDQRPLASSPASLEKPEGSERWQAFQGQMIGPGLSLSYQGGNSGIDKGIWHHGGVIQFLLPLERLTAGRGSLFFQIGYQNGEDVIHAELRYTLHAIHADIGFLWTLFERDHWWLGAGGLVRFQAFVQALPSRPQQDEAWLLSWGFGPAAHLSLQYGFAERWFLQTSVTTGLRILNLGGLWSLRWDLSGAFGVGLRF